ncbi:hypothetical protein [Mucilaginibacter sp. FT3.2]|uniref:hypothetical protein n=1 Tax=Mucilaginibacter sp. FT3.2 TaxID=2723090 RepID=UPI001617C332|nr:hypothetical protein [Mucilaginibacter sp. FT3.2]MBB6232023.1 hypothetical protein [Mucilaginibacter sp. FT3.2]
MIKPANYNLYTEDGDRIIIITPVNQTIPGGNLYATGVFALSEGEIDLGDIVFDDDMNQWEYSGMGDLTHQQAEEIAGFIKNYQGPEAEDRELDENRIG